MKLTPKVVELLKEVAIMFNSIDTDTDYEINFVAGLGNISVEVTEQIWHLLD